MFNKANNLKFEEINAGDVFEFEREVTEDDVNNFAKLSGDKNPLHLEEDYAQKTQFGGRIVQGLLLASFFSALVGMYCPGKNSLYLSQSLNFRKPLTFGKKIKVKGEVTGKSESLRVITLKTTIYSADEIIIFGEAKIKIL